MHNRIICFVFFLATFLSSIAQQVSKTASVTGDTCRKIRFQKIFAISIASLPSEIMQTKEGGYLISGIQTDETIGNGDGLLLKLNKYGQKEWIKGHNRTDADYTIYGSAQLPDSSFIIVADQFDSRGILQKTDKNGTLLWQKAYGSSTGAFTFQKIIANSDGTFIIIGILTEVGVVGSSLVIKFDGDGNIIWQKPFNNGNHFNYPTDLFAKGDTLIVNGILRTSLPLTADTVYIMKMAILDGAVYKAQKLWFESSTVGNASLINRTDNNYILTTDFIDLITGTAATIMTFFDPDFNNSQSVKLINIPDGSHYTSVPSTDNGVVIIYQNIVDNVGNLIKFDHNLQPVFAKYYPQSYRENSQYVFTSLLAAADSGYAIAGFRNFSDSGVLYVIKTDPDGNTGTCNSVAIAPSVQYISVSTESFLWEPIYSLQLSQESILVPDIVINNSDNIFCNNSTCTPDCNLSCSITSTPVNNTYTGGNPYIIYLGYGSQGTILQATVSGGTVVSYNWTGPAGLSCTNCAAPLFSPASSGSYTFTCLITLAGGCTTSCDITICVIDVRVPGTNSNKVYLCHVPPGNPNNPQQLSISVNAVPAHLSNHTGDRLGLCGQSPCAVSQFVTKNKSTPQKNEIIIARELQIVIFPNPSQSDFSIKIISESRATVTMRIRDINGRLITESNGINPNQVLSIGANLKNGIYLLEILQGGKRNVTKLIKLQ